MKMSLNKLQELVMDREAWRAAVPGVTESDMTEWTELNWTELEFRKYPPLGQSNHPVSPKMEKKILKHL